MTDRNGQRPLPARNQTSGVADPQAWLVEAVGGGRASSGAVVNAATTLGIPAVWNAVEQISGHLAAMEVQVKRELGGGQYEIVKGHPVSRLFNESPGQHYTPFTFREALISHALLQGNGRAYIERNQLGQPVELLLLLPWHSYCYVIEQVKYHIAYIHPWFPQPRSAPRDSGGMYIFPDEDVFHIPGLSYNGFWGMHLMQVAREAFGISIAGQDRTGSSFRNNGAPGFLVECPQAMWRDAKRRAEFKAEWKMTHEGSSNAGKMGLLWEGMKAHAVNTSAHDSQLVELRKLSREDVRMLFGLSTDSGTAYKSITERNTQYLNNCLNRWIQKIQQEIRRKMFSDREKLAGVHSVYLDHRQLVMGDPNTAADYTGKLRQQGAVNGNEVRVMHGLEPVADPMLESYGNPNITTTADAAIEQDQQQDQEQEASEDV